MISTCCNAPPPWRSPSCIAVAHGGMSEVALFFAAISASMAAFFASLLLFSAAAAVARLAATRASISSLYPGVGSLVDATRSMCREGLVMLKKFPLGVRRELTMRDCSRA